MTPIDIRGLFESTVPNTKLKPIKRSSLGVFFEKILHNPPINRCDP
jgi:hypothetical protein